MRDTRRRKVRIETAQEMARSGLFSGHKQARCASYESAENFSLPMFRRIRTAWLNILQKKAPDMPTQIVMDRSGDSRHQFDAADAAAGERRFRELTARGFTAVALGENGGDNRMVRIFDPNIERTLFIPQLEGG